MSVKNILILKHYNLKNPTGWDPETEAKWTEKELLAARRWLAGRKKYYKEMEAMCIESAWRCIPTLDDVVVITRNIEDIQAAHREHFFDIHNLWRKGDVNLLYCGLDTLFVREYDWFGNSRGYMMYDNENSDLRFHGHDMDPLLWDLAFKMIKDWNYSQWEYEQKVYQEMEKQCPTPQKELVLNNTDIIYSNNVEDAYNVEHAAAIHFHGTKGTLWCMKRMRDYLKNKPVESVKLR